MELLKTGTTTVGIVGKDWIVLASEKKSLMGHFISSKEAKKIWKIKDDMAITIAGGVGDAQTLVRLIKAELALYELNSAKPMDAKAASTLISNVLQSSKIFPFIVHLILAGFDENGNGVIYALDPFGGMEEERKFYSTGSGSPIAFGVLEEGYREDINLEEAKKLAVKAIKAARERDAYSGGKGMDVGVVIKGEGIKFLSKKEIEELEG